MRSALLAFAIILVVFFSGCTAPPEEKGPRILFQSARDAPAKVPISKEDAQKYFELYTMNIDGSGIKRITNNSYWENQAVFSPDGKKILFAVHYNAVQVKGTDPGWEIAEIDADGSNLRRLTNNDFMDFQPHYNHNGTKIVFTSDSAEKTAEDFEKMQETKSPPQYNIYTMNSDGTGRKQLTFSEPGEINADPGFSFNEPSRIVYISSKGLSDNFDLYLMDEDGGNKRLLLAHDSEFLAFNDPMFSYNGEKIIFSAKQDENGNYGVPTHNIFSINIDGTDFRRITQNNGDSDILPQFSPDGSKISYCSYVWNGNGHSQQIRIASSDGSNEKNLSSYPWETAPAWTPE